MSQSPKKLFILDTSVLLSSPYAIHTFAEHDVVLPLVVIKELEGKRNDPELGHSARTALRALETLRTQPGADLREGVSLNDDGGTLRIEINHVDQSDLPDALRNDRTHDTRILAVANAFRLEGRHVVVVSKDLPMRILAETLGLEAEEYKREQVIVDKPYTGVGEEYVGTDLIDALYAEKRIPLDDFDEDAGYPVNTGLRLIGPTSSALATISADKHLDVVSSNIEAWGVKGRSSEQRFAIAHLLNPAVPIVSLGGIAGSGKTLLALAAALEQTLEKKRYSRIIVFRPLYAVGGQDLGYLPGTAEEKMGPWGAAIFDALRAFTTQEVIDEVLTRNLLEVLPLTHIRGRSLHNAYVLVDEAQSLERPVLLTALSRIGEQSKIVLSHDVAQRDNLHVGRHDGIAAVVERLKGEPLFAHVTFTKSERGPVAELATRLLDFEHH